MAEIAGLKLIVPTSVAGSGVSVSASGKVSFTAATSVSVNGVFDSTYDNYLVVFRTAATVSTTPLYRLRSNGTDTSTTTYVQQQLTAQNTTVGGSRDTAQNAVRIGNVGSTLRSGAHIYFYGPYLAQPTAHRSVTSSSVDSAEIFDMATTQSGSTSFDGFTIFVNSGNMTGALCVYGLSQ